jgi:hypothetical protein
MHAMAHGHEGGIILVLCAFAKGGAAEGEGVGFEEGWEEAGADVGAGLEEWRVERVSSGGIEGNG